VCVQFVSFFSKREHEQCLKNAILKKFPPPNHAFNGFTCFAFVFCWLEQTKNSVCAKTADKTICPQLFFFQIFLTFHFKKNQEQKHGTHLFFSNFSKSWFGKGGFARTSTSIWRYRGLSSSGQLGALTSAMCTAFCGSAMEAFFSTQPMSASLCGKGRAAF
jgi:hypothetical protein